MAKFKILMEFELDTEKSPDFDESATAEEIQEAFSELNIYDMSITELEVVVEKPKGE